MRKHRKNPITEGIRAFQSQISEERDLLQQPFSNIAIRSPNILRVNMNVPPSVYKAVSDSLADKPQLAYQLGEQFAFPLLENVRTFLYILDQALLKASAGFKLQDASGANIGISDILLGFHQDSSDSAPKIKAQIEDDNKLSLVIVAQTPLVFTGKSKIQNLANATFDAVREAVIKKHYSNLNSKALKKKKLPAKTNVIKPLYNANKNEIHTFQKGFDFENLDEVFKVFNLQNNQELDSQDVSEALIEEATNSTQEDLSAALSQVSVLENLPLFEQEALEFNFNEPSAAPISREVEDALFEELLDIKPSISLVSQSEDDEPSEIQYTEVSLNEDEDTLPSISSYSEDEIQALREKFSDDISEVLEAVADEVDQVAASVETSEQLNPSIDTKAALRGIQDAQEKLVELLQSRISSSQATSEELAEVREELKEIKGKLYKVFQQSFTVGTEADIDSDIIKDVTHRLNAFADYYNLEGDYVYEFTIKPKVTKVTAKYDGANAIDVTLGPKNTIVDIIKALAPKLHDMWSSEEYDFDDVRIDPYLIEQELLTLI